jgi:hypothetical protein
VSQHRSVAASPERIYENSTHFCRQHFTKKRNYKKCNCPCHRQQSRQWNLSYQQEVNKAIEWAKGFDIPSTSVDSDMRKYRAAGLDFKVMAQCQISVHAINRLSKERVDHLLKGNPERDKLNDLADGMVIPHCPTFIPNALGVTTPPRDLYLRVHSAVDKMLFSLHKQGLAFILPKEETLRHIPNLNLCKAHWARKKG